MSVTCMENKMIKKVIIQKKTVNPETMQLILVFYSVIKIKIYLICIKNMLCLFFLLIIKII